MFAGRGVAIVDAMIARRRVDITGAMSTRRRVDIVGTMFAICRVDVVGAVVSKRRSPVFVLQRIEKWFGALHVDSPIAVEVIGRGQRVLTNEVADLACDRKKGWDTLCGIRRHCWVDAVELRVNWKVLVLYKVGVELLRLLRGPMR
jgi:hypothetical protein